MNTNLPPNTSFRKDVAALTELTLTVFKLHGALLLWGDKLVDPLGLTSARWQVLGAIALAGVPLTAPQVGGAMGVTRQGAQKQLNLLLELGLVEAGENPAHQRSPLYALTARGRQLYDQAEERWTSQAAALARELLTADVLAANVTLDMMLRHLTASTNFPKIP